MFIADLHVHSKFSRACSKDCDIEHLSASALRKGITVLGTGDFTHPAWAAELRQTLVAAEPGLFRMRPELERRVLRDSPPSCAGPIRFMLSVEISTIYRRAERTRKVHHLLYAPSFDAADRITAALARIGNLASDGRPILGLDSRDLLEITLSAGPGCFLVPAHVWTPWFAVLGSKSGFDAVRDCYADLAGHVFAVETGLSSDPPMNWTCSSLDAYRLVSNSDAHSPPMLGREATVFGTQLDYFAMAEALRTGAGLGGTIEFFPEEGKYHLDGHRKCGVRVDPEQTRALEGACPACGKPLTVGVLHRVAELADRPAGSRPAGAAGYACLVQLPEIVGEIRSTGPRSKSVAGEVGRLVGALGPELAILRDVPLDDIRRAGGTLLGEGIARLRRGEVIRDAGYDGEYGTIRLFRPDELEGTALFAVTGRSAPGSGTQQPAGRARGPRTGTRAGLRAEGAAEGAAEPDAAAATATGSVLDALDPDQRAAATAPSPLLIIAGPGTGKTRTLTYRIAHQVTELGGSARDFLAITFTRRAAQEMRDRLAALGGGQDEQITVTTFHGLGLRILREHHDVAGLPAGFGVADEAARLRVATEVAGSEREGRRLVAGLAEDLAGRLALRKELAARGLVDFDGLVSASAELLAGHPAIAGGLRARWPRISVDEYQDIDAVQYDLLRMLCGDGAGLTAIGDPDQAIYRFRGADVGIFAAFTADFPAATTVELTRNYRSSPPIVTAAMQAIAPTTLVPGRKAPVARAVLADPRDAVTFHEAADEHAEAAWIAAAIDQLLGGTSFHSLDSGRADGQGHGKLGLSDIAVLYRTDAQAGPLGQALTRAGLPYQKRSHDLLAGRAWVAEILREMRLDASPDAERDVVSRLAAAVRALAAIRGERDATVIDIRAAGEVLTPLARRCGTDVERFRAEISLGAETDALDPRAEAITLLTLHGAKGLEFDVVFLAGCESGLLPLRLPGSGPVTPDEAAEERRLLFVGMTRARGRLLLTCAARRTRHGSEEATGRSPFLAAIDPGLLSPATPRRARPTGDRQLRLL
jgi:DNA helicase II / ATP-dependent DNA helicase PcrA